VNTTLTAPVSAIAGDATPADANSPKKPTMIVRLPYFIIISPEGLRPDHRDPNLTLPARPVAQASRLSSLLRWNRF
jgi:hypothetical protein